MYAKLFCFHIIGEFESHRIQQFPRIAFLLKESHLYSPVLSLLLFRFEEGMKFSISPRLFFKRTLFVVVWAFALVYCSDYLWFRVRLIRPKPGNPLESFTGPRVLAIQEKGGRTSYEIDQQNPVQTTTCVHSLFQHAGFSPCWYVKPRLNQPIPM